MVEQRLAGGRTLGAVRIAGAVHRTAQPWTRSVHAVLRHLQASGFTGAPRVLGFDEQGREMLIYLEGETVGEQRPWPAWVRSESALRQVGRWLRRLHDTTATFIPPDDAVWFVGQVWRPGLVIGHHDAAPFNAVWRGGNLVGFIDWDTAGPASREMDLAYVALSWVPLYPVDVAVDLGYPASHDRTGRLQVLLDAYGYDGDRVALGPTIAQRAQINAQVIRRVAASGDPVYQAMLPVAETMERSAQYVAALPDTFWHR
jgi:hypothetical protein